MKTIQLRSILCLVVLIPAVAPARTWYVKPDSTGDAPTIHAGLDSACCGDTVLVAPGTYLETDDPETRIDPGPGVCLTSEAGPELTIVEFCNTTPGIGLGTVISCEGARVSGFTIRFGSGPDCHYPPAPTEGISCWNCTDVMVENCIIENVSYGIYVEGSSSEWWKPVFRNNIIRNCAFGIACYGVLDPGRPFFQSNIVTECNYGTRIMESAPIFQGNEITHCRDYGMYFSGNCAGGCDRNTIAHNERTGVYIYADPPLGAPSFNGGFKPENANDFYDNGGYDIWYNHSSAGNVLAQYNYWGGDCPDFSSRIRGNVWYSPWVDATHTRILNEDDCQGATGPSTWGSIKAMYK